MHGSAKLSRRGPEGGGAPRALVVESDPGTRELCRRALEDLGFVVETSSGGVAALAAARQSPPSVILLDLQLRDVEGAQFVAWLRSDPALEASPVIAICATAEDAARLPRSGFAGTLRKPLTAAIVAAAVLPALAAAPRR